MCPMLNLRQELLSSIPIMVTEMDTLYTKEMFCWPPLNLDLHIPCSLTLVTEVFFVLSPQTELQLVAAALPLHSV